MPLRAPPHLHSQNPHSHSRTNSIKTRREKQSERGERKAMMSAVAAALLDNLLLRSALAVALAAAISARAYKRKSLDRSGTIAGFVVMAVHIAAGYRFGAMLLVFFFTSSKLTRIGEEHKRTVDADFKEGGQRNWIQVLANSAIATILVVALATVTGGQDRCLDTQESILITSLIGGILGHYACCNGDTWSSEIGMLSNGQPRLITTFKVVRKGTNGGITKEGLLGAMAAGFVIGLSCLLAGLATARCAGEVFWRQLFVVPIGIAAGLGGSLIDSLLGATLQYSGYCSLRKKVVGKKGRTVKKISGMSILDNNGVNAVSILLTTFLTSVACSYIF